VVVPNVGSFVRKGSFAEVFANAKPVKKTLICGA